VHPLLVALAKWPGRQPTKALLAARGYALPDRYRGIILANLDRPNGADLDHYWDEVAKEYICAAGRVNSNHRAFSGETSYRSAYLDGLAAASRSDGSGTPTRSLHAGLRQLLIEGGKPGNELWPRTADQLESSKASEIKHFEISASEWTRTKADLSKHLSMLAESRGFEPHRKKWRKKFGAALEFRCFMDTGSRSTWSFQLPLVFEMEHSAAKDLVLSTWQFDYLMPSFRYYHQHRSPEAAILGIQAHIDLLDAIGTLTAA
jgi:hypothetical protein